MPVMTETPLDTKEAIHVAVAAIQAVCDGAEVRDGVGFNGSDVKFGHRAALIPASEWTDATAYMAHQMLLKYEGQLSSYGIDYHTLPVPNSVSGDGRDDARQQAREIEGALSREIDFVNGEFVVAFQYDATVVTAVKNVGGARWDSVSKRWYAPEDSAGKLKHFGDKFEFARTDAAAVILNKTKAVKNEDAKPKRRLYREGTGLVFEFPYEEYLVDAVKAIQGRRWDSKRKVWVAPSTSLEQAIGVAHAWDFDFEDSLNDQINEIVREQHHRGKASEATKASIKVEGLGSKHPDTGVPLALRPFQQAGVAYAVETKRCFIADEMGLGKTVQALASVQYEKSYPVLVVCPASLKVNWQREVRMWLPGKTVHIVDNQVGVKNADVVIVNYDILSKQKDALAKVGFQSLIFDESHYVKTKDAQRTKALKVLAEGIPANGMILALTGTPVLNRPLELVSQLEILGRIDDLGGSWNFRKRYCDARHNGYGWDFKGSTNTDELNERLRMTCYVRRNKEDVLKELPPKARYSVEAELSGKAIADYRAAEADILAWLGGEGRGSNSAEHLSRITTLKRLAGEGKVEAAIEWIDTFLDSTDRKLVVFAHHISVVDTLAEQYGGLRVAGKDSSEARQAAVDTFQTDPEHRVIVLNMKAGGVGLTLTAASDVLFVEQGWTPAEHEQAEDRCHRIGQDEHVSAWYLLAEGTIDDDIYALIEKKRVVVDAVTDGEDNNQDSVLNDLVKTLISRTRV